MEDLIRQQQLLKQGLNLDPVKQGEKLFNDLVDADFTISPWIAPEFWICMRDRKFAESYISQILKELEHNTRSLCDRKGKSDKNKKIRKQEMLLSTMVHLVFAYRRNYAENIWRSPINSILKYNEHRTASLLVGILPYLENPSVSMENVIIPMFDEYDIDLLQLSIPFYSFMMLLRMIHLNKGTTATMAKIFTSLLKRNSSRRSVFVIIHIIRVLLSAFPGLATPEWESLKKILVEKISMIEPISSLAAETAAAIDKEMQNHGKMYHETLRYILDFSPATDGIVPFLFDQSYRFLGNFLYTHSSGTDNYDLAIVKFVKWYIRSHFQSTANPEISVFYEIFSRLKFTEKNDAKLAKEFNLTKTANPGSAMRAPRPPLVSFDPIKFHVHVDFDENVTEPFSPIENCFKFPTKAVFNKSIMLPLSNYLSENPGCDMIDQKILLAGNDIFISTVLLSLISSSVQRTDIQRSVSFTFFVLPLCLENEGSISQFIAKADPVYEKFVHSVYDIVSNIAPVYNEESKVSFVGICEDDEEFDSHPWFTDPAPQNAFRFAIQHFMMFARSYVDIYVWKVSLIIDDSPAVIVPMIGSLHLGPYLCKEPLADSSKPRMFNIRLTNCRDEDDPAISQKLTSIAVWNADEVTGVAPWDNWLLVERTSSTSAVNRISDSAPVDRDLIHGMQISESQRNKFSVMIDQRMYHNILDLSISFMQDLSDPTERMKMKFATFGVVQ